MRADEKLTAFVELESAILATIRVEFRREARDGTIELSKTMLTHRFAANPSRRGAMTPARLYNEVLPDLQKRGLARLLPRNRKLEVYQFPVE